MTNLPTSLNTLIATNRNHSMTSLPTSLNTLIATNRNHSTLKSSQPITCHSSSNRKLSCLNGVPGGVSFPGRDGVLIGNTKRVVLVRINKFGGGGGGGGGGTGGRDDGTTRRVLVNLGLAIGLTYLTMTGQLGWILDAIVSIWLLAIILPIAGLGAFLWWAGQNIVQGTCPNCGKESQVFKSSLKDGLQLCPYCTQPFSVEGDEFVRESSNFTSNQSTTYGQAFSGFSSSSKKGKASSLAVVDIEAEVKDVE